MPSRILREGINSSDRVNALSPGAEILYRRLMSAVDDYGRYYGSPATVRTGCWPVNPESIREQDVSKWLTECQQGSKPLITVYRVGNATYLQLNDFNQQIRSKSKFPAPCEQPASTPIASCDQPANNPIALVGIRISESDFDNTHDTPPPAAGLREQLFEEFWSIVWAKIGVGAARKAWKAKVKGSKQARRVIEAAKQQGPGILQKAADNGIGVLHPATWLNQERYEDETRPLVADSPVERVWTPEEIAEAERATDEEMRRLTRLAQERRVAAQEKRA